MTEEIQNVSSPSEIEILEMSRQRSWRERIVDLWNRWVQVDYEDPELARQARLFNVLMVVNLFMVLLLSVVFILLGQLGLMPWPDYLIGSAFPLSFIPLTFICIAQTKRGHVKRMINFYVWLTFLSLGAACALFDGPLSGAWVLFLWPVSLAGTLLRPVYALRMSGIVVTYYFLMLIITRSSAWLPGETNLYTPPFTAGDGILPNFVAYILIILVTTAGIMTFLNARSSEQALGDLRETTQALEKTRRSLETRVEERTMALAERAQQFQSIAELNRALAGITELETLLDQAVQFITERFGFYHVGIFLLDDRGAWLALRAVSSEAGQAMLTRGHRLPLNRQSLVGYAAATARPRVAQDVSEDESWFDNPDLPETHSELALPLIWRGEVVGVLDVQSVEMAAFSPEDEQVLQILADDLAISLESTRLLRRTQQAVERLERYQEEEIVRGWRRALARRKSNITYAYDRVAVQAGLPEGVTLPVADPAELSGLTTLHTDDRFYLLAPIRVRSQTLGVLSFESQKAWSEESRQLVGDIVSQLALALENARLLEDTRLSAAQERTRSEIVSRVRASVQVDAILRSAAEELGRALQVDRARLQLIQSEREE